MDPLISAFAPSLSSSLAQGAAGALEGEMAGEDRLLKNQLLQAQADWQRAHAANYGMRNRMSLEAMNTIQQKLAQDPNFLSSPHGRLLSSMVGHVDLGVNDARIGAYDASEYERMALGDRRVAERDRINTLTPEEVDRMKAQGFRSRMGGIYDATRAGDIQATQPGRVELYKQKGLSEQSLQGLRGWQKKLAEQRAEMVKAQKEAAAKGGSHALNLYSYAEMLNQRVHQALEDQANGLGPGPDYNDILILEDLRDKLRGPDFGAAPLGGTVFDKRTGKMVEPEVPPKEGFLGSRFGATPGTPATPPAKKPLNVTPPVKKPTSSLPGAAETDQNVLKAQKLIKDKGVKFADDQLKKNKKLTPTEKLALQKALEKAMTEASLNE